MATLAANPDGVLIPTAMAARHGLSVGDRQFGPAPTVLPEVAWLATGTIAVAGTVAFAVVVMVSIGALNRVRLFEAIAFGVDR